MRLRSIALSVCLFSLAGCLSVARPPRPPVIPPELEASCQAVMLEEVGRPYDRTKDIGCIDAGRRGHVEDQRAYGRALEEARAYWSTRCAAAWLERTRREPTPAELEGCAAAIRASDPGRLAPDVFDELVATWRPAGRRGPVRLEGAVFTDDDGPFQAVGASLFWGVWGFQHDQARLEENLRFLADHRVDYIRVLGVVGPTGGWADRLVDARAPNHAAAIAGLTDLAYDNYGLRVEWTIFGGIDSTPDRASRRALVDRFLEMSRGREAKILHFEIANEGYQNFAGADELRELTRYLAGATTIPVAATAPSDCTVDGPTFYAGTGARVLTLHLDRNVTGEGGLWRPVRQAWEAQFCQDRPATWTSNEPIGPGASGASDDDPMRLAMSAGMVYLAGGAGYVYHARAGIRGGGEADMVRGGPANLFEVAHAGETLEALRVIRTILPFDLANWQRHNTNRNFPGRPFDFGEEGAILRNYCATRGAEIVCLVLEVRRPTTLIARVAMDGKIANPITGDVVASFSVNAGERVALSGLPGFVITATRR